MAGLGGGVIIAFAAALWLLYLTPTWLRRREYVRTERTAVRLQQTLRVLAETAEVPEEVRAEVSARSVAEQHRALRESARRAESIARANDARAQRRLARSGRQPREPKQRALAVSRVAAKRQRRSRVLATNLLVIGITVGGWGASDIAAGGTWELLIVGVVMSFAAVALLQRASTVAAAHRAVTAVDQTVVVQEEPQTFIEWEAAEPSRPTWTPVPLPKPRYLEQQEAVAPAPARNDIAIAASLRAAAQRADDALRAAYAAPEVAALHRRPPVDAVDAMNESGPVLTDLDGVLRRRRSA
jgi:predicted phage tail protein